MDFITIDWPHFTPWAALLGGGLIGVSAIGLAGFNGRIAGISGILAGVLRPVKGDTAWRVAFVLGMLLAPWAWQVFSPLPASRVSASTSTLALAGLLVGVGTRYGSGCTSGHGVCGLSRLSVRSLVATMSFMAFGFITVYITRHFLAV
jgi:uncharacterized membrane protein YedE/YeeE